MGYFFALIPPFLDGFGNYIDKFLLSKYNVNSTMLAIYSGYFAFTTGVLVFFFSGLHITDITTAFLLILSGVAGLFILLAFFKALTLDEASRVGSLFQLVPVFVLFLSYFILNEHLTLKQYIGCFSIIVASILFSAKKIDRGIIKLNQALFYMILASFFSAMVYVLFKIGAKEIGFWETLPFEGLGNGIAATCILFYGNNYNLIKKETRNISKRVFLIITIIEFLYRVSRYAFFFSLTLVPASIVSILQGFQPVFLVIIGIILSLWFPKILKEVVTKEAISTKLIAIFAIFVGLTLIFL